jgi:protein-serine/threonine kinase
MSRKKGVEDFQFGSRLGEGSYSQVFKAVEVQSRKVYAIKILSKKHIVKEKKIKYVNIEKSTLNRLGRHPGIVTLYYTFQDDNSLYFVIDLAEFGELLTLIRKYGSLSETCSRYYMAQLIDAVEFMHSKGVIHRDLKPENILVNGDMRLMLTDFGAAKLLDVEIQPQQEYNSSFVGTAEYVSPELLKNNKCGFESDIWAMGCILYQFIVGLPPFKGTTDYLTFEKIVNLEYKWPKFFIPELIKDIVSHVLLIDPTQRLTIQQLKQHPWFGNLQWNNKSQIWGVSPPKMEPYNPNVERLNQTTTQFTQLRLKKPSANAVKKQLLTNTINQIRNDGVLFNGLENRGFSPLKPAPPKILPTQQNAYRPTPSVSPKAFSKQQNQTQSPSDINNGPIGVQRPNAPPTIQQRSHEAQQKRPSPLRPVPNNSTQRNRLISPIDGQFPKGQYPKGTQRPQKAAVGLKSLPGQVLPKSAPQITQSIPETAAPQSMDRTSSQNAQPQTVAKTFSQKVQPLAKPSVPKSQAVSKPIQRAPKAINIAKVTDKTASMAPQIPPPKISSISEPISIPQEVLSFLKPSESIIKLDFIHLAELKYSSIKRDNSHVGLDDLTIHKIIKTNESTLHSDLRIYGLALTDLGHLILFQHGQLQTVVDIIIDLTNKLFAMYDYEFDEVDQSGYLILEVLSKDRLIFLSPMLNRLKGYELIGESLTWIDALLKTKQLLKSKTPTSTPTPTPTSPSPSTSTSTSTPSPTPTSTASSQVQKKRVSVSKTARPLTAQQVQQQNKKFAGGAAAAAFKRMK